MPSTHVLIEKARREQDDLCRHREHASARPDFLQALGLDVGRQAMIRRDADSFALYTIIDAALEASPDSVRMGRDGRARLDSADKDQFDGFLDTVAVDPAATVAEALSGEKLLELLDDDGHPAGLIAIAPHGGDIERFTDFQAEHVRALLTDVGVSCWRCKGWNPQGSDVAR